MPVSNKQINQFDKSLNVPSVLGPFVRKWGYHLALTKGTIFIQRLGLLLGALRRPSQGSASVFCYYYLCFLCSEFPARLQSINPVTKPGHIQRGRKAQWQKI